MTQSNLLDSAKQGDPEAIAQLMNFTLQSKGIAAEAKRQDTCLEIVLTSSRSLNPKALVSFVQKGLANLGVLSIQIVKVCGKKPGEDTPEWVEAFEVSTGQSIVLPQPSSSGVAQPVKPLFNSHLRSQFPAISPSLRKLETVTKRLVFKTRKRLDHWLAIAERATTRRHRTGLLVPARVGSSKYITALTVAILPAFLLGAIAAVIASFAQGGSSQTGKPASNGLSGEQTARSSLPNQAQLEQQVEVKTYLDKMNKAQRDFYLKHGRFASSLEELERSANLIALLSQSNYTFRLTVSSGTQARLTAVPKAEGLRSFTGIVLTTKAENGTSQAVTTLCESKQPAQTPPSVEVTSDNQIQCSADSVRIS
jgi:hypothetical protein